eukprot:Hpha_TRINITY_DN14949_c3_g13::TRINITY_DN14949_c3_g13_i1::g.144227::m.144227
MRDMSVMILVRTYILYRIRSGPTTPGSRWLFIVIHRNTTPLGPRTALHWRLVIVLALRPATFHWRFVIVLALRPVTFHWRFVIVLALSPDVTFHRRRVFVLVLHAASLGGLANLFIVVGGSNRRTPPAGRLIRGRGRTVSSRDGHEFACGKVTTAVEFHRLSRCGVLRAGPREQHPREALHLGWALIGNVAELSNIVGGIEQLHAAEVVVQQQLQTAITNGKTRRLTHAGAEDAEAEVPHQRHSARGSIALAKEYGGGIPPRQTLPLVAAPLQRAGNPRPSKGQHGGQPVHGREVSPRDAPRCDHTGPPCDAGHSHTAFVHRPLPAPEWPRLSLTVEVNGLVLGPVVARVHYERLLVQLGVLPDLIQHTANLGVQVEQRRVVNLNWACCELLRVGCGEDTARGAVLRPWEVLELH